MTAATAPPMSIQTALSVGEPVKKRETSELKEFVALMPMMMRYDPANEQGQRDNFVHNSSVSLVSFIRSFIFA